MKYLQPSGRRYFFKQTDNSIQFNPWFSNIAKTKALDQDALANDCPGLKLLVTSVLIDSPILALAQPVNIIDGITRPIVADKQVLVAQHSINLINCKLNIVESLQEYNALIVDTKQCFGVFSNSPFFSS